VSKRDNEENIFLKIKIKNINLAAHCVVKVPGEWTLESVRVGEWDTASDEDCEYNEEGILQFCAAKPINIKVVDQIVHPLYNKHAATSYHDIAILRLAKPVKFTDDVKPICLPLNPAFETIDYTGYTFEVTGWGKIEMKTV
jgi:hypothetical protein